MYQEDLANSNGDLILEAGRYLGCEYFPVQWLTSRLCDLNQCDQMIRLFAQYLAIFNNENLPKYSNTFRFCQSGNFSPNLVTLNSQFKAFLRRLIFTK